MPSIISLITKLHTDFPHLNFQPSSEFRWSPDENTVFYDDSSNDDATLLHELSHALLGHKTYTKDVQLLAFERDAWEHAQQILAPHYSVFIPEDTVQDSLDTYRDWLHSRSICPHCQATGVQIKTDRYKCIACSSQWRVNDARTCGLKRYKIT